MEFPEAEDVMEELEEIKTNETFADYVLGEKDYIKKLQIVYYLQKKQNIFFDKTVIFKTELARMFIEKMNLDVDKNLVLTACMLCACKKSSDARNIIFIQTYAKEGAEYLKTLGFSERFCKICEEMNRYSGSQPREPESDILELVDNFGGMVLHRPERRGFPIDEAMTLVEYRNLKGKENRYLDKFKEFIRIEEGVNV